MCLPFGLRQPRRDSFHRDWTRAQTPDLDARKTIAQTRTFAPTTTARSCHSTRSLDTTRSDETAHSSRRLDDPRRRATDTHDRTTRDEPCRPWSTWRINWEPRMARRPTPDARDPNRSSPMASSLSFYYRRSTNTRVRRNRMRVNDSTTTWTSTWEPCSSDHRVVAGMTHVVVVDSLMRACRRRR